MKNHSIYVIELCPQKLDINKANKTAIINHYINEIIIEPINVSNLKQTSKKLNILASMSIKDIKAKAILDKL